MKLFGSEEIDNTATGIADAIARALRSQGMPVNDVELRRWAEFDFARRSTTRSGGDGPEKVAVMKPKIKASSLCSIIRTYLRCWYGEHMKWLRQSGG